MYNNIKRLLEKEEKSVRSTLRDYCIPEKEEKSVRSMINLVIVDDIEKGSNRCKYVDTLFNLKKRRDGILEI